MLRRCRDFDNAFYPLRSHDRDRWLSIAAASQKGTATGTLLGQPV